VYGFWLTLGQVSTGSDQGPSLTHKYVLRPPYMTCVTTNKKKGLCWLDQIGFHFRFRIYTPCRIQKHTYCKYWTPLRVRGLPCATKPSFAGRFEQYDGVCHCKFPQMTQCIIKPKEASVYQKYYDFSVHYGTKVL
jgi:hypothetical protein